MEHHCPPTLSPSEVYDLEPGYPYCLEYAAASAKGIPTPCYLDLCNEHVDLQNTFCAGAACTTDTQARAGPRVRKPSAIDVMSLQGHRLRYYSYCRIYESHS